MTRYAGNDVAYGSGGSWHVWVDVTDDGSNTGTSTGVHYTYGIYFSASISDSSNAINWTDNWGAGSANNSSISGAGDHTINGTNTNAASIQYGGGTSIHFHMAANGMATNNNTSSVDFDYALPARSGGSPPPPSVPDAPGTNADLITSNSARIWVYAPASNGGAPIDAYAAYIMSQNQWPDEHPEAIVDSAPGGTFVSGPYMTRGTPYFYTARAHNAAGWSAWTGMKMFYTLPTVPDTPVAPSVGSILRDGATISWSNPNNGGAAITGHAIQIATDAGFTNLIAAPPMTTASPYVCQVLEPNTPYYARVSAYNTAGWSAWSATRSFLTLPGVHLRVSGAWVNAKPHNRVAGAWVGSKTHGRVSGAWS